MSIGNSQLVFQNMAFLGGRSKKAKGRKGGRKAKSTAGLQKKTVTFKGADGKTRSFTAHVKRRRHYASAEELAQSMHRKGLHPSLIKNAVAKWRSAK